jgi:organic radical activating enzyme
MDNYEYDADDEQDWYDDMGIDTDGDPRFNPSLVENTNDVLGKKIRNYQPNNGTTSSYRKNYSRVYHYDIKDNQKPKVIDYRHSLENYKSLRYKHGKVVKKKSYKNEGSYDRNNNKERFAVLQYNNGKKKLSWTGARNLARENSWTVIDKIRKKQRVVEKKKKTKQQKSRRRN